MLKALRASNSKYTEAITFINVDWDKYKNKSVVTSRKIPRRSTIVVIKDGAEIGRIVAGTSKSRIRALLNKAL